MAKRDQFNLTLYECRRRTYSETFKRGRVHEIESGQTRASLVCKQFGVSDTAVRRWLCKFGVQYQLIERLIIETMSDTLAIKELKERELNLSTLLARNR